MDAEPGAERLRTVFPVSPRDDFVREPKQERSRLSFDKALDAAVELLAERRSDGFTLAEVARRAGVSIGSMYGRVHSKEALIRAAHAREMERMDTQQRAVFGQEAPDAEDLPGAVRRIVVATAELLRRNAGVLGPFMLLGSQDPHIFNAGRPSYERLSEFFRTGLLAHRDEIGDPDPESAADWAFVVVYSVLARHLGLGSAPEVAGQGNWDQIVARLVETVTAFMARPPAG